MYFQNTCAKMQYVLIRIIFREEFYGMCGIVGYIGTENAQDVLLNGLAHLEYRGYDSAGVAIMEAGELRVTKAKGRLDNLRQRLAEHPLTGTLGIGHTRWATHGEPSDLNAHPHTDVKGDIAIVHNGIIENHQRLRTFLEGKGCTFVSQTDTEVIAHLLHYLYHGDMCQAIREAAGMLEGSWALCVLHRGASDTLWATRKDSPLVLGLGQGENLVASDIPALLSHTREVALLEDKEIAEIHRDSLRIFDPLGHERPVTSFHVDWDVAAAEKGGWPHFMIKEIHEEPEALQKTLTAHVDTRTMTLRPEAFPVTTEEARVLHKVSIVACGTAYHAGVIGKYLIERLARLPAETEVASEFRYRDPMLGAEDLFLAVSQSGETADTLAALREARKLGARALALTNVVGSSMARETGRDALYTWAGPEIAVASTKAYITQVEMMALLAIDLGLKRGTLELKRAQELLTALTELPAQAEEVLRLAGEIQRFASRHFDRKHVFYIGRGLDWALAMEASLKLKEVSYIFSEAYAAGELKHGTIALIEEGSLVCALLTQHALADKVPSNIREVKSRGAHILMICAEDLCEKARAVADELWLLPSVPDELAPLLAVIPVQLLAYYMAVSRGCDVDKPRNLAKSVTVE